MKKLGFGLMRLPKNDQGIDIEQVKKMVDLFMAAGCTYFDTAWIYAGSEDAIRQALVERYPRDQYQLATKAAAWAGKTREEAIAQFQTSLDRTQAGYFDYYLMHNLGLHRTEAFEKFDMWNFALEQKAAGTIRHLGFSFHSTAEELDAILQAHPEAEFVQLQINYADWEDPRIQAKACYEVARKHGKPVIVMEPVKGGLLANTPGSVSEILKAANPDISCVSWAIRFAASLEGVMTVLSGMSNVEQMQDNLSYMTDFQPLSEAEQQVIVQAREALKQLPMIPCTSCDYCAKVCPENIAISGTFEALNILRLYNDHAFAAGKENWNTRGHGKNRAIQCIRCGKCEQVCPQHIEIRSLLQEATEKFTMTP